MEKLAQHIETLLRRHDFVIVPDFGGFVTQHQSAKIDDEQINPPLCVVGFNPLMNVSDGLLAIEISRAENKSFREAVQMIDAEVAQLKQLLLQKEKVVCGNLGTLFMNNENKILFSPSENSAFIPSNYGFNNLFYTKTPQQREETNKRVTFLIPSRSKIVRYAAVGIIAVGLFLTAPKLNDARNSVASLNPVSFIHLPKDSSALNSLKANPAKTTTLSTEKQQNETKQVNFEKKYHVIVGCMSTQKKAESLCNYLKESHYSGATILPKIKTYRVAVESFTSEKEAVAFMENLRATKSEFHDAWVLNF